MAAHPKRHTFIHKKMRAGEPLPALSINNQLNYYEKRLLFISMNKCATFYCESLNNHAFYEAFKGWAIERCPPVKNNQLKLL